MHISQGHYCVIISRMKFFLKHFSMGSKIISSPCFPFFLLDFTEVLIYPNYLMRNFLVVFVLFVEYLT